MTFANVLEFCRFWKNYPKICKITAQKAFWWLRFQSLQKIYFMIIVGFFQKNQLGIGLPGRKWAKNGLFWPKIDFYSECGVLIDDSNNFILSSTKTLSSLVVCVIWGDLDSSPSSGTWFLSPFKLNTYFKLFIYACIS